MFLRLGEGGEQWGLRWRGWGDIEAWIMIFAFPSFESNLLSLLNCFLHSTNKLFIWSFSWILLNYITLFFNIILYTLIKSSRRPFWENMFVLHVYQLNPNIPWFLFILGINWFNKVMQIAPFMLLHLPIS